MTGHLAALYRVEVTVWPPPDAQGSMSQIAYAHVELGSPSDEAWSAAWDGATWPEKVQNLRWLANVICRVWVALSAERFEQEHYVDLVAAEVLNPVEAVRVDGTFFIDFRVAEDYMSKALARTKTILNEVLAADQDPARPPDPEPQEHAGVTLSAPDKATAQQEEPR